MCPKLFFSMIYNKVISEFLKIASGIDQLFSEFDADSESAISF